eukprot:c21118_g1_i1 orf=82-2181(+)
MLQTGEADIPALLVAISIVVLVTLGIFRRAKVRAARKVEILRLQRLAAEETARIEAAAAEEYKSLLLGESAVASRGRDESGGNPSVVKDSCLSCSPSEISKPSTVSLGFCAQCSAPTNSRCSRCKAVRYCSSKCQVQHWKEGHRQVCREPEALTGYCNKIHPAVVISERSGYDIQSTRSLGKIPTASKIEFPSKSCQALVSLLSDGHLPIPKKILFPYECFVKLFKWDMPPMPPCGLMNCGNSCFANVVLQCLTYTRPLAAYLLQGIHAEKCQRNSWCLMCELQCHVNRVRESQIPFSPIGILSQIRNIGNHLGYGRQEDAHEFMRFAVDSMQSICLHEVGGEKAVDPRSQETTFIQHIFGGHLRSQVKCMQCHNISDKYENMMDLTVEIQGNLESLEDALTQYTAPEWLDGENKYKCDRCNAYVEAKKCLTVHEAPNILTIALKRFQGGKFGKLNKHVSFTEVLDMSPYMSEKADKPPHYRLYAAVVHVDTQNASFFGHYICYVRDTRGSWYKVDDSMVIEVDLEQVMQQRAYMLLYARSSPRPAPFVDHGSNESIIATDSNKYCRPGMITLLNNNCSNGPAVQEHSPLLSMATGRDGVSPFFTGGHNGGSSGRASSWIGNSLCSSSSSRAMSSLFNSASMQQCGSMEDSQVSITGPNFSRGSIDMSDGNGVKNLPIFSIIPSLPHDATLKMDATQYI